jgi:hypothetical protein
LSRAGITWDSTLGYADVPGFCLGVCRPVPLFDPVSLKPFGIVEHPLTVMDVTLNLKKYQGFAEEAAFECCKRLLDRTRAQNGEFVMLWHNNSFGGKAPGYHPKLYRRLLALACEH